MRDGLELYGDVDYDYDNDNDNEEADSVNNRKLGPPSCSGRSILAGFAAFSGRKVGDE